MKVCDSCKYAEWKRTANGRLHPDKSGRCKYEWKLPPLPASMFFHGSGKPSGGFIKRGREHGDHCPTFEWKQP